RRTRFTCKRTTIAVAWWRKNRRKTPARLTSRCTMTPSTRAGWRFPWRTSGSLRLECGVAELVRVRGPNSHEVGYETPQLQRTTRFSFGREPNSDFCETRRGRHAVGGLKFRRQLRGRVPVCGRVPSQEHQGVVQQVGRHTLLDGAARIALLNE